MKTTHIHIHRTTKDAEQAITYRGVPIKPIPNDGERYSRKWESNPGAVPGLGAGNRPQYVDLDEAKRHIDLLYTMKANPKGKFGGSKYDRALRDVELGGMKIGQASNGKFEVTNIPASLKYGSSLGNFASEQAARTWIEKVVKQAEAPKDWKVEERDDPKSLWKLAQRGLTEQEAKDIAMEIQQEGGVRWQVSRAVKGS